MGLKTHPVHMMVIHFPSALLVMDSVFAGIALYTGEPALSFAGYYCLMAGVISGWVAILTGIYDWLVRILPQQKNMQTVILHAVMQSFVVTGFTIILSMEFHHQLWINNTPSLLWLFKGTLLLALGVGNFYGGEVLSKYFFKQNQHS